MYYGGIDYHKKYSVLCVVDEGGEVVRRGRVEHENPKGFEQFLGGLGGAVRVVFETSGSWSWLYEVLEQVGCIQSITVANPYKTRLIAEAQIKTDKLDAQKLALLLRGGWIPAVHVPPREIRQRKQVLRQRTFWVKERTRVRNRIHRILERQHGLQLPQVTDLFGSKGRAVLNQLALEGPDQTLLQQDLGMLDELTRQVKATEKLIAVQAGKDRQVEILQSVPGIGPILANVVSTEVHQMDRFISPATFTGYAGLAPQIQSSGGKTYCGGMITQCNKWLKWAFIEASWVAISRSCYFGALYRHHRSNIAISIVARRLAHIAYTLLKENRLYEERPLKTLSPVALGYA